VTRAINTALFRSWHALVGAVVILAFTVWRFTAGEATPRFHLATGWCALALFLVVLAYVLRKYVHKLGISPEFRMRVPIERLERAESQLAAIRVRMANRRLTDPGQILREAKRALRQEGVHRVVKVRVEEEDGELVLRALPTGPLGRMSHWMHAHLYYGITAAIFVLIHGRLSVDSAMAIWLNGLSLLVIATGLAGIGIWAYMPGILTRAERDLSIEKAHALSLSLDRKVEAAREELDGELAALFDDLEQANDDFETRAAAAMRAVPADHPQHQQALDLLALLGQRQNVRQELRLLTRIKRRMNLWRTLHVPGAVLLISVVGIHVISVLWY